MTYKTYRIAVPADLFIDVEAPEFASPEAVQKLAVDKLVSIGAVEGFTIDKKHHLRVYAKNNFDADDVRIENEETSDTTTLSP